MLDHGKDREIWDIPKRNKQTQLSFDILLQSRGKKAVTGQ